MIISSTSFSILLMYLSVTGVTSVLIFRSQMPIAMKLLWVGFVSMLPFLGAFGWFLVQSFDHKFQMDGRSGSNNLGI